MELLVPLADSVYPRANYRKVRLAGREPARPDAASGAACLSSLWQSCSQVVTTLKSIVGCLDQGFCYGRATDRRIPACLLHTPSLIPRISAFFVMPCVCGGQLPLIPRL